MAQSDLFYVLVRTLQRVAFSLPNGPGSADLRSNDSDIFPDVRRQNVIFKRIQSAK